MEFHDLRCPLDGCGELDAERRADDRRHGVLRRRQRSSNGGAVELQIFNTSFDAATLIDCTGSSLNLDYLSGNVSNAGTIHVENALQAVSFDLFDANGRVAGSLTNSGLITIDTASVLTIGGLAASQFTNSGNIRVDISSGITLSPGSGLNSGLIAVLGESTGSITGVMTNNGTIEALDSIRTGNGTLLQSSITIGNTLNGTGVVVVGGGADMAVDRNGIIQAGQTRDFRGGGTLDVSEAYDLVSGGGSQRQFFATAPISARATRSTSAATAASTSFSAIPATRCRSTISRRDSRSPFPTQQAHSPSPATTLFRAFARRPIRRATCSSSPASSQARGSGPKAESDAWRTCARATL